MVVVIVQRFNSLVLAGMLTTISWPHRKESAARYRDVHAIYGTARVAVATTIATQKKVCLLGENSHHLNVFDSLLSVLDFQVSFFI